jgi:hypothetical protein
MSDKPARNWALHFERRHPMLIDIRNRICTDMLGSQPLWLRRHAWNIRRTPRLYVRTNRAMILWDQWRTACPPAYRPAIYGGKHA